MTLLLESALRSLLLGLLVWAALKLTRVRDSATESIAWTFVLVVALCMPLLSHYLPRLVIAVPHLSAPPPLPAGAQLSAADQASPTLIRLGRQLRWLVLPVYALGLMVCLTRLVIGLVLTFRLYLSTAPVQADWARGRRIRVSAALKSPASLAQTILLPADFPCWSAAKRQAVLAHEAAHIARRDFFVQLAASVHCALFWFSPFAWWLRAKLTEVAEVASDEAAARHLNDPLLYAEILLEVARGARGAPLIIAMAKGPLIQQRIDRLLCGASNPNLSLPSRMIVVAGLTLVALTVATVTAAVGQGVAISSSSPTPSGKAAGKTSPTATSPSGNPGAVRTRQHSHHSPSPVRTAAATPQPHEAASYNPRALLDPVYTPERVVADVSAADATYRSAH
jgi:beta-lactamase regulating signal transducer with metallopeptidase domain